jgi:hypothetical protein
MNPTSLSDAIARPTLATPERVRCTRDKICAAFRKNCTRGEVLSRSIT